MKLTQLKWIKSELKCRSYEFYKFIDLILYQKPFWGSIRNQIGSRVLLLKRTWTNLQGIGPISNDFPSCVDDRLFLLFPGGSL
jgi:hypothetical protein